MEITPRELRDVEIRESFRGYSRDDVNELLERAASTLEAANERMQQMNERLSAAQSETGHTRETEDILHRTLLLAQRAADEAVGEATAKSRQMLDDAEIQAKPRRRRRRGRSAPARRDRTPPPRGGSPRPRGPARRVARRRRGVDALRGRLPRPQVRALEADLTALRNRPPASPGTRPEPTDVDLPVLSEGFARREPSEAPAASRSAAGTRVVAVRVAERGTVRDSRSNTVRDAARAEARSRARAVAVRGAAVGASVGWSLRRDRPRVRGRRVGDASGRRAEPLRSQRVELARVVVRQALVRDRDRGGAPARPARGERERRAKPRNSTPRSSTTTRSSRPCGRPSTTRPRSGPATRKPPARTCSSTRRPTAPASATSSAAAASPAPGSGSGL